MSLIEQLKKNQLEARKNHEKERLSLLQVVLSVLKNESIAKQKELSDEEVVEVLQKQVKQLNDAMQDFARGGREDLVENNKREIAMISEYLPEQLSEDDVLKEIEKIVAEIGDVSNSDFGKVMGLAMTRLKGRADGNIVSKMVKQVLTK